MYGNFWDRGHFMKNFHFDTICNISREPQELQYRDSIVPAGSLAHKSAVIKYQQLLSKVTSSNRQSCFDQLAAASSSTPPYWTKWHRSHIHLCSYRSWQLCRGLAGTGTSHVLWRQCFHSSPLCSVSRRKDYIFCICSTCCFFLFNW